MTAHFDRIVIGGGAMGLATTWQLAARGLRVLMLEQFTPGHDRGASHGATRNMNNAYAEDHYLDLYDEALTLWRALENASGRQLLTLGGLVTHGDPERVREAHSALQSRGAATELITPSEAAARWPGMRFEGAVLVNRDAGRIHAATALEVLAELAGGLGAELRHEHRVLAIDEAPDRVTVIAASLGGATAQFTADSVVATAGAWSTQLVGGLAGFAELPPLRVTEEHPAHFAIRPECSDASWPSFNHFRPRAERSGYRGNVYGMLTPGEGVKVGFHATGDEVDPDHRRFRATDEARAQLREYVAQWFPGVDPGSAVEVSCTYTMTPSERFVLDRRGRVVVGAGFSGQGFKFVPAVGRVLADLSLEAAGGAGTHAGAPQAFRLASHTE